MGARYSTAEVSAARAEWLAALRRPGQSMCSGTLEHPDGPSGGRCALGHAVALFGGDARRTSDAVFYIDADLGVGFSEILPSDIARRLDITPLGWFVKPLVFYDEVCRNIAHVNDKLDLTLRDMADVLEDEFASGGMAPYEEQTRADACRDAVSCMRRGRARLFDDVPVAAGDLRLMIRAESMLPFYRDDGALLAYAARLSPPARAALESMLDVGRVKTDARPGDWDPARLEAAARSLDAVLRRTSAVDLRSVVVGFYDTWTVTRAGSGAPAAASAGIAQEPRPASLAA